MTSNEKPIVSLLDYGAGNVRSVRNAIRALGYTVVDITDPSQILEASVLLFPGVGSFGTAMKSLTEKKWIEPLTQYLKEDRPYLGICLGMQTLFDASEECEGVDGLGILPGIVTKFLSDSTTPVPQIGWNGRVVHQTSPVFTHLNKDDAVYFVHSYYVPMSEELRDGGWVLTSTEYGGVRYVSAIQKGNVVAMQFHPEKSGQAGLNIIQGFLEAVQNKTLSQTVPLPTPSLTQTYPQLVKRVVVALDVRTNDSGDLVVTKGDQYDVREKDSGETTEASGRGNVRNLGKPVSLAERYYNEGADEIAFLNITSFRGGGVLEDAPMLQVLEAASEHIFVPLTVGGGIRSYVGQGGVEYSALEVASRYFRAGADKISIGSDAVYAAEAYWKQKKSGGERNTTSLEAISQVYGVQAVVVSIDPKRVYLSSSDVPDSKHTVLTPTQIGPNGETSCYYQCTVKGGREKRPIDAIALAKAAEALGAGEIMLNCIDMDGTCSGYDLVLMNAVCDAVSIPVIASSGAGTVEHFGEVFEKTKVKAALAAGMFHRKEVGIDEVKSHMEGRGLPTRRTA